MSQIPEIYFPRTSTILILFYHSYEASYVYIFLKIFIVLFPFWVIPRFASANVFTQTTTGVCLEGPALSKDYQFEPAQFVPIAYLLRWARPSVHMPHTLGGEKQ